MSILRNRLILILAGAVRPVDDRSWLGASGLSELGSIGHVERVTWNGHWSNLFLRTEVAEGPLRVAAMKQDPPEQSVHFALDALSLVHDQLSIPGFGLIPELEQVARRLNSRTITALPDFPGMGALVWENGSIDLRTTPPARLSEHTFRDALPTGEGDTLLTRYIEDSVNLLQDAEFNRKRSDEGLPPINVLWPHSHGFRPVVPNLQVRLGYPVLVVTDVVDLLGLSYLCGFSQRRLNSAKGLTFPASAIEDGRNRAPRVVAAPAILPKIAGAGMTEEAIWILKQASNYVNGLVRARVCFDIVALPVVGGEGLRFAYDPLVEGSGGIFDERLLEEPGPATPILEALRL
ncbi:MAG TPA: hypothetical protein PKA27_03270 [Fimbriimonadaceae bacterium]|nr:hypothetical protein [Fimbriimonadaceae bacterium]